MDCSEGSPAMKRNHAIRACAAVLCALVMSACASMTVNRALEDPSRYRNKELTLSGNVKDSYSVGSKGVYRIDDGTASLWVASDHGVPRKGAKVKVTGTLKEGYNLGSLASQLPAGSGTGVVLVEREHHVR